MMNLIENELEKRENVSITENGAVGYKSSGNALVDLNYKVSSLRNSNEEEIIALFDKAFYENKEYALKWLFYARDVREGLGERRLFRICYKRLAELDPQAFNKNLVNISEYGRWDDLVSLVGINSNTDFVLNIIITKQLNNDMANMKESKPISLLAKWLPSENASSKKTKELAKKVRILLGMSSREYRLMLSKLRKYLNVVEVKMCNNEWEEIDYEKVPSMANLRYKNAFLVHDENRRGEYLDSVRKGSQKINMKVATPVDIVSRYSPKYRYISVKDIDETLELAWKNLKDIFVDDTLVVADGSGSMLVNVGNGPRAIDVANALAIYTSEHNGGIYKNKYITFSENPRFVKFNDDNTLMEKINIALSHDEFTNTNIEAVFQLILDLAIENEIPGEEMIDNVLIISDMEFDMAQSYRTESSCLTKSLFDEISDRYSDAGYKLPKLIFWNVNSRTGTIPVIENELGVVSVSGFSQNVLRMVMSSKYDPYDVLIEVLDGDRYSLVRT